MIQVRCPQNAGNAPSQKYRTYIKSAIFVVSSNLKNQSYVISEQVYEDGLTMDNFYRNIRRVYFASISAQMIINDVVSGKFKGIRLPSTKMGTTEDETGSPEDLYYS